MLGVLELWSKAKTVLASLILIAACSTVYLSICLKAYAPTSTLSGVEKTSFSPPLPPEYYRPLAGEDVSLAEAQAAVPFKIQLPTNTGGRAGFMQVKLLQTPETNSCAVFIVYAADELPSNASRPDVYDHDGILLLEMPLSQAYGTLQRAEINFKAFIDETGSQAVSINGYFGSASGNIAHCVQWATETTYYRVEANVDYPLQQLVEIAQSIPVN
jgi:hypothetical protein